MATRAETAEWILTSDADALDEAAKIVRRRMKKPAGISTALFCRTMTMEASALRAEAATLRASTEAKEQG